MVVVTVASTRRREGAEDDDPVQNVIKLLEKLKAKMEEDAAAEDAVPTHDVRSCSALP